MRCFGNYKDDRICDICEIVNTVLKDCKMRTNLNKKREQSFWKLKYQCENHIVEFEEYDRYEKCKVTEKECKIDLCPLMD